MVSACARTSNTGAIAATGHTTPHTNTTNNNTTLPVYPVGAKRFHRHYVSGSRHYSTGTVEGPSLLLYLETLL